MHRKLSTLELIFRVAILLLFFLFFMFPFYWIIATSLKTQVDAFAIPPKWFFNVTWAQFALAVGTATISTKFEGNCDAY